MKRRNRLRREVGQTVLNEKARSRKRLRDVKFLLAKIMEEQSEVEAELAKAEAEPPQDEPEAEPREMDPEEYAETEASDWEEIGFVSAPKLEQAWYDDEEAAASEEGVVKLQFDDDAEADVKEELIQKLDATRLPAHLASRLMKSLPIERAKGSVALCLPPKAEMKEEIKAELPILGDPRPRPSKASRARPSKAAWLQKGAET